MGYQKPEPKEERVQLPPRKRDLNRGNGGGGGGTAKGKKPFNKHENNVDKDNAETRSAKGKNQPEKEAPNNKNKGAQGKRNKRYNFDDATQGDDTKVRPKSIDRERHSKPDRRDDNDDRDEVTPSHDHSEPNRD